MLQTPGDFQCCPECGSRNEPPAKNPTKVRPSGPHLSIPPGVWLGPLAQAVLKGGWGGIKDVQVTRSGGNLEIRWVESGQLRYCHVLAINWQYALAEALASDSSQ